MNHWTSYNLLFFIKRTKLLKSGKASLFLKISAKNKHAEFVLNCSVRPELWNKNIAGAMGNSREAKLVNEFINSVKFKFQSIINKMNNDNIEITAEKLKNKYLGIEPSVKTLLEIFNDHNQKINALTGVDFSYGTYQKYVTTYRFTKDYISTKFKKKTI